MRIELPIINEPDAGLCTSADLTGNGQMSKILISTYCRNTYISESLYNRLEGESLQLLPETNTDSSAYYLNDLTNAKAGVIKSLRLPGRILPDVSVVVTQSFPAYKCDMVLGIPIISAFGRCEIDPDKGFIVLSDEQ
ncbi:MAG: hypothetical protein FWG72_08840 [Oscillospiraceae bacterium]|nr:hypothetical protein [Oscillospiraceae bacterium]